MVSESRDTVSDESDNYARIIRTGSSGQKRRSAGFTVENMTYHELIIEARRIFDKADASSIREHVAVQFDVTGYAAGTFYLEVKDGEIHIEPYPYYDHDARILASAARISGNIGKVTRLHDIRLRERVR